MMQTEGFQWQVPETFNFGSEIVDRWAAEDSDRLALIWTNDEGAEEYFTFRDIAHLSGQCANFFVQHGLRKGDRILIVLPRIPLWQIVMTACTKLGAIAVPCISMLSPSDIEYRITNCAASAIIAKAEDTWKIPSDRPGLRKFSVGRAPIGWTPLESLQSYSTSFAAPIVSAEDPAIIYYTSGSTGLPKGVVHAARALYTWRQSAIVWLSLNPGDRMWCTADTGWSKAGTSILFGPWSCGATVHFHDGIFNARTRFALIERHRIQCFCASATEFRRLLAEPAHEFDLSSLETVVSAGESVNPEVLKGWRALTGLDILDGYGQTETLMTIVNRPGMAVKPGSMGRALPGTEVAVLTADGHIKDKLSQGQLVIRTPNPQLLLTYWQDPDRTKGLYREIEGTTWFQTGDEAYMDEDGYLFYRGRNDDIINTSGYRVGPQEVENALGSHPAVQECAVVGRPDAKRGEIVVAHIVLKVGYLPTDDLTAQLQSHVKTVTAPYKYPRRIVYADALPKTATGKIKRHALRNTEIAS